MCGRYSFDLTPFRQLQEIAAEIERKYDEKSWHAGEIFPTNNAPVLMKSEGDIKPELAQWGFPHFKGKGVIINARAETAPEKRMFQKSLMERRCVIPSSGFYEWTQDKANQKHHFVMPNRTALYMAGLFHDYEDIRRFVILTTEANASVRDIHHRMPVVLPEDKVPAWIEDTGAALSILKETPPELENYPV